MASLLPLRAPRTFAPRGSAAIVTLVVLLWALHAAATPSRADAAIERSAFLTGLAFPTNLAFAPDGRLFFTEKDSGLVRIVSPQGRLRPEPFARFAVENRGETGMLGIALDPSFTTEPWVYLYFSDAASGRNRLVRVRDEGGSAGPPQVLGTFLPWSAGYHNGGDLVFGPDGMLYVAVGEAHEPSRAQDPDDVGGKILRLAPDGSIPPDNPFGASPAFTIGHRNSFGLCVDPATDELWETENGPNVDDEVNVLRAGRNYGWPDVTGDSDGRFADPVVVFPSPEALTGCAVWRGDLWFGAAVTAAVYRLPLDGPPTRPRRVESFDAAVIDLAVGPDDAVYVATANAIHRLADDRPVDTATADPTPGPADPTDGGGTEDAGDEEPVVMPARDDGGIPPAVPIAAAIVLATALVVRFRAGRDLRRAARNDDAGA